MKARATELARQVEGVRDVVKNVRSSDRAVWAVPSFEPGRPGLVGIKKTVGPGGWLQSLR
jgi:hypothetical protein